MRASSTCSSCYISLSESNGTVANMMPELALTIRACNVLYDSDICSKLRTHDVGGSVFSCLSCTHAAQRTNFA